jgi:hypothetical protein
MRREFEPDDAARPAAGSASSPWRRGWPFARFVEFGTGLDVRAAGHGQVVRQVGVVGDEYDVVDSRDVAQHAQHGVGPVRLW